MEEAPPAERRTSDFITTAQLELMTERFGRSLDNAVTTITGKVELLQVSLEKKLEAIEASTDYRDRALASRIDAADIRMNNIEKELTKATSDLHNDTLERLGNLEKKITKNEGKIEELGGRASKNWRVALGSFILPTAVGITVYVIEKLAG